MINRLRGGKRRCQYLTGLPKYRVAEILSWLARPSSALISETDTWMPCGKQAPKEARLGNRINLIDEKTRRELVNWWLYKMANTPNWDIASECVIEGARGLLLVEAKAHEAELHMTGKGEPKTTNCNSWKNHEQIGKAIVEANAGLNKVIPGWALSRYTHYQLSNRFAWSWKLASLGVPVVLIYLGFINAAEMSDRGKPFDSAKTWERCIKNHSKGIVPDDAWNKRLDIGGTPLWCLIRSTELTFSIS